MDSANEAFFSSPFEIDRQHRQVMDECTIGGSEGRRYAELMYAFQNPQAPQRLPRGQTRSSQPASVLGMDSMSRPVYGCSAGRGPLDRALLDDTPRWRT